VLTIQRGCRGTWLDEPMKWFLRVGWGSVIPWTCVDADRFEDNVLRIATMGGRLAGSEPTGRVVDAVSK
jgi:hypothetical protein